MGRDRRDRGAVRRVALAFATVLAAGCAPERTRVPFHVVALGPDPFFGGTISDIVVAVERGGVRDDSVTTRYAPDARELVLPPLPHGGDYALVVETELDGLTLGRGRSFPFSVSAAGAERAPDVTLGAVGRFASLAPGGAEPAWEEMWPTDEGALLTSTAGLARFVAHEASTGLPTLAPTVGWPAARVGGFGVGLGTGALVVGGTSGGAALVLPDGTVAAELGADVLPAAHGMSVVTLDESSVLVAGGATDAGEPVLDVVKITLTDGRLSTTALPPLTEPRLDAEPLAIEARTTTLAIEPRVMMLGGTDATGLAASSIVLLDPSGGAAPQRLASTIPTSDSAACALDVGLVLVAGGRDAAGTVVTDTNLLVVQLGDPSSIEVLSPAPPRLFRARAGAYALSFGAGLALVVGGVDASGAPLAETELAEVRLDALPGSIVLSDRVVSPAAGSSGTRLSDHTLLVSTGDSVSLYFPPRGE